jgi:hypothetical protein
MPAPLGRNRPRRRKRPPRRCLTPGCGVLIESWPWLCGICFSTLPLPRKREICAARQAGNPAAIYGLSRDAGQWVADRRAEEADK